MNFDMVRIFDGCFKILFLSALPFNYVRRLLVCVDALRAYVYALISHVETLFLSS